MNDIMYYSELAEEYYETACPKFAINGYEKNVLIDTDTERCIFISGDIELNEEQLLFRCKRSKGKTIINLKNNIRKPKKVEELFPTETRKRYEGKIRIEKETLIDGAIFENEYILLPHELKEGSHLLTRISNLDHYLDTYTNNRAYYLDNFEILADLEKQVANAEFGFLPKCILISYKDDGDVIFFFSYFEEDNMGNLFAIYEFDTTVS